MLSFETIQSQIMSYYGNLNLMQYSASNSSDNFITILQQLKPTPKICVEIGTYNGISSAILASMCDYVYTFDINFRHETEIIWGLFNARHKIKYTICKNSAEIDKLLTGLNFDFAFIDGEHTYEGVKKDYEMIAPRMKPVNILFHDIQTKGVEEFIDEIGAQKLAELAYLGDYKFKGLFTWKDRRNEY
jgi:predicted O-methyltransferase YrrM